MLTRSGVGAAVVAVALAVCGTWWNYEELVVIAACLAAAIVVALWSSRVSHRATIQRRLASPRVARGDPIRTIYRATNTTRRRSSSAVIVDTCDGERAAVPLPSIPPDDRTEVTGLIPTRRRGQFPVGPWMLERYDVFGLARGRRSGTTSAEVLVHPRIFALEGPHGSMHLVEDEAVIRRAASDPLSGFVSLREYVAGDDTRLIHWPTSARVGSLMIREHVEVRRPEFTVVLDTARSSATPDDFEEAVDVVASIGVHALRSGYDVRIRTTSRSHPGARRGLEREAQVLDLLTVVEQSDELVEVPRLFDGGLDHTTIMLVTGPAGPSSTIRPSDRLTVVRIGAGAQRVPGVAFAAETAATFAQLWRPWA